MKVSIKLFSYSRTRDLLSDLQAVLSFYELVEETKETMLQSSPIPIKNLEIMIDPSLDEAISLVLDRYNLDPNNYLWKEGRTLILPILEDQDLKYLLLSSRKVELKKASDFSLMLQLLEDRGIAIKPMFRISKADLNDLINFFNENERSSGWGTRGHSMG